MLPLLCFMALGVGLTVTALKHGHWLAALASTFTIATNISRTGQRPTAVWCGMHRDARGYSSGEPDAAVISRASSCVSASVRTIGFSEKIG